MNTIQLHKNLGYTALAAGLVVFAMIVIGIATGASQEYFERPLTSEMVSGYFASHPLAMANESVLFALDGLFAVLYLAVFTWLSISFKESIGGIFAYFGLALMIGTGILDLVENYHIQAMLHQFASTGTYPTDQSYGQFILSNIKFHLSYIATFIYGLGFIRQGGFFKLVGFSLWFGYLPFGLISQNIETPIGPELALIRTAFFTTAFLAIYLYAGFVVKRELEKTS